MSNWGVSLDSLQAVRPDIIFASVSGYGRQGPLAEYPANGATTEPMSGFSSMHGYEGDIGEYWRTDSRPYLGLLSCRFDTNCDTSSKENESGTTHRLFNDGICGNPIWRCTLEYSANGDIRKPKGNKHADIAPHGLFKTRDDEWIAIATETDQAFRKLCKILNLGELSSDDRFTFLCEQKSERVRIKSITSVRL